MPLEIKDLTVSLGIASMAAKVLTVPTGFFFIGCMTFIICYGVHRFSGRNQERNQ
ncbi:hypothetical protein SKAU_G00402130 [Synaphobranchus kaupii]|uniref:Uncharacterized protein n=1 Tax=Synaphobranchus kaupii TaxID=118154 RepID=A0A9Q1ICE3_SYNKA|nr:hypothetical protein SKAU_G00402130 [Synaphobranchus kaupii]